ncbi:MAG: phosphatidylglycerophosphatase A [Acidiferrobacterales bacterium]
MGTHRLPAKIWTNPIHVVALGFGVGALPYAPGTAGTLVAIPLYLLLASLSPAWYAGTVLLFSAIGVWICDQTEARLGMHDHPGIVWDEIVGYLVAMFMAPPHWVWVVVGFALFRLFDIWKPFPIRTVERRIHGGFGTMLDDALAGVYAWVVLQMIAFISA